MVGGFAGTDVSVGTRLFKLTRGGGNSFSAGAFSFNKSSVTSIAYCSWWRHRRCPVGA